MKQFDSPFSIWIDNFFDSFYRHRPVDATFVGIHEYDDNTPNLSRRGRDACAADMVSLLRSLRDMPVEPLTDFETIDKKLAEGFLEIQLWEHGSPHFYESNPSLYVSEAVFGILSLLRRDFAPFKQRLENAVQRLNSVPILLEQCVENVQKAPRAWTLKAIRECTGAIFLLDEGLKLLTAEQGVDCKHVCEASERAVTGFKSLKHYLETNLIHRGRDNYGCGEEGFDLLMRKGHFISMDAEEIHAYAREQFFESEVSLTTYAKDFDVVNWKDAIDLLQAQHPSLQDYYPRHMELWEACKETVNKHQLFTWPDCLINFVPRPSWLRRAAPYLYLLPYHSLPAFDSLSTADYLMPPIDAQMSEQLQNTLLRGTNDSVIKLNHVIHHASVGHHVQNWYAYKAESRIGRIAAIDCASRLAFFCGGTMAEGWATYSTKLMDEFGLLTPLEHYSLYHARLRAAARAIVDVSLHTGQFTFEQAQSFYHDRVHMSEAASYAETVKNSMFPGAAMMYLIGSDMIHNLRNDISIKYKDSFDLKQFHDSLLSYGSIPVSLIVDAMSSNRHTEYD